MLLQCQLKEVQNMELPDLGFPASTVQSLSFLKSVFQDEELVPISNYMLSGLKLTVYTASFRA